VTRAIREFFQELFTIVVIALLLAVVLRVGVVEGRVIPSGSMIPTIHEQDRVMVCKFIYWFEEPQRGDIVVFEPPEELGQSEDFIKRVVGLPGETVEVRDGKVFINGKALDEPYIAEPPQYEFGPVVVPADSLFVMGDNRNRSFDSHMWNGWLTRDHLKGKAFMIYWPLTRVMLLEREVGLT
jgi:signal peptidase I